MLVAMLVVGLVVLFAVWTALERYARRNAHDGRYFVEKWARFCGLFTAIGTSFLFVEPLAGVAVVLASLGPIAIYLAYYRRLR